MTFDLIVSGVTQKTIDANVNNFADAFTISNGFGQTLLVKGIQIKYRKELKTAQIRISQTTDATPFIKETQIAQIGSSNEADISFKIIPVNRYFTNQSTFQVDLKPSGLAIAPDDVSVSLFCDYAKPAAKK